MRTLLYTGMLLIASLAWGWDSPFVSTPVASPFTSGTTATSTTTTGGATVRTLNLRHLDPRMLAEAFNIRVLNVYGPGTEPAPYAQPYPQPAYGGDWYLDPVRGWVNRVTGDVVPLAGGGYPYPPYPTYPQPYPQPYPAYPQPYPYPPYPTGAYPPAYQPYQPYPPYVNPPAGAPYPVPYGTPYTGTPYAY